MLTDAQRILLEDKAAVWERAAASGTVEWQDYNRRAAEALRAALSLPRPSGSPDKGEEPVAWTGSGSLAFIKNQPGEEGFIWGERGDAHPIPLYARPSPGLSRNDLIDAICEVAGWGASSGVTKAGRIVDRILSLLSRGEG